MAINGGCFSIFRLKYSQWQFKLATATTESSGAIGLNSIIGSPCLLMLYINSVTIGFIASEEMFKMLMDNG